MEECYTFKDQNFENGLYFRQEATFFHKGQSQQDSTGNGAQGLELKEQIQYGVRLALCYTTIPLVQKRHRNRNQAWLCAQANAIRTGS